MSETNEVTEIVERVREHLAAAVGIGHPDEEGYIDFLTEILAALTAATKRAEAAEARRREIDDEAFAYAEQIEVLRAERDALRQYAAVVQKYRRNVEVLVPVSRELLSKDWSKQPLFIRIDDNGDGTHSMTLRESTAASPALAVHPTTGETK